MDHWDPHFIPYRLRVVRIGVEVSALTLATFVAFHFLPGGGQIPNHIFWPLWVLAAVAAVAVHLAPWERMFRSVWGRRALYAWSAIDILLITALIAWVPHEGPSLFFLYILTTVFFSLSYTPRSQFALFSFTAACYATLFVLDQTSISPADLGLRVGLLGSMMMMASFTSRELMAGMDRAMRESEEARRGKTFYESMVRAQSDLGEGVSIANLATQKIEYVNDAACEMSGFTRAEMLEMSYLDLLEPEEHSVVDEFRLQRVAGLALPVNHHDFHVKRKDGRPMVMEVVWTPLDEERVVSLSRDVTAQRQIEQELASKRELFLAVSELSSDYAYSLIISPDGQTEWDWVTEGFKRVTGYSPEEWRECGGWPTLLHPDDLEEAGQTFRELLSEPGKSAVSEFRITAKNGEIRHLRGHTRTVWDHEQGRAIRLYGAVQDVTDTKRAESALRASEERYRSLFERVPLGLFLRTLDGRGLDANPACVEIYGFPDRETFVRTPAEELYVRPEDRHIWVALLERGEVKPFEVEMRKYDGSTFWARLTARPVRDPSESVIFFEGAVEDVTQRRAMEEQLRQAQKMEAVGRLAGGVAHDFNNLLTAILGYCELLRESPELSDATRQDIGEIDQAAQMGADIARQLLDLSRRRVLRPEVLDLNEVVATMEPMLKRLIGDDIVLETQMEPSEVRVEADRSQIEQIVLNLVVNARDAMPDGGEVCISTLATDLSTRTAAKSLRLEPGPHVMLSVADTGVGIDPSVRERIFEPFFTTRTGGGSTGLGLSTIYGIVSQYKGHIAVDTELGGGTTVRVYLPAAAEALQPMARSKAAERWLSGEEKVLLVEDDRSVRKLARRALERFGYHVVEASEGTEALAVGEEFDVLVTDVVMPGMSGREVAQKLLERRPRLRILYMSGYTGEVLERFGDLEWNEDFIAKPFRPDELAAKVREVLNRGEPHAKEHA